MKGGLEMYVDGKETRLQVEGDSCCLLLVWLAGSEPLKVPKP